MTKRAKAKAPAKRRNAVAAGGVEVLPGRAARPIALRCDRIRNDSDGLPRPEGVNFTVHAEAGGETVIDIYDIIGFFGVTAIRVRAALKSIKSQNIRVRINSPGGDVFDGIAIYNDLVAHPARVEVEIVGLAASAASLIAMAGDNISIADNAFIMIHNAWVGVVGDRNELAKAGRVLDRIDAALARTYAARAGVAHDEVVEMMDDETWLDSAEAISMGFADETLEAAPAASASLNYDLSTYLNVPSVLMGPSAEGTNEDIPAEAPSMSGEDLSQFHSALVAYAESLKGSLNAQSGTQPA